MFVYNEYCNGKQRSVMQFLDFFSVKLLRILALKVAQHILTVKNLLEHTITTIIQN